MDGLNMFLTTIVENKTQNIDIFMYLIHFNLVLDVCTLATTKIEKKEDRKMDLTSTYRFLGDFDIFLNVCWFLKFDKFLCRADCKPFFAKSYRLNNASDSSSLEKSEIKVRNY